VAVSRIPEELKERLKKEVSAEIQKLLRSNPSGVECDTSTCDTSTCAKRISVFRHKSAGKTTTQAHRKTPGRGTDTLPGTHKSVASSRRTGRQNTPENYTD